MLTPEEIRNKRFEKNFAGSYRSDEVDEFVAQVSAEFDSLVEEKNSLEDKLEVLAEKLEEYRGEEMALRNAIIGAQKLAENVQAEAKTKAEQILGEALIKSEKMLSEALIKSEGMVREAEAEATALMNNLKLQAAIEQDKLTRLKNEVSDFKQKLQTIYRSHLELISELPENEQEIEQPEQQSESAEPVETEEAFGVFNKIDQSPTWPEPIQPATQEPDKDIEPPIQEKDEIAVVFDELTAEIPEQENKHRVLRVEMDDEVSEDKNKLVEVESEREVVEENVKSASMQKKYDDLRFGAEYMLNTNDDRYSSKSKTLKRKSRF